MKSFGFIKNGQFWIFRVRFLSHNDYLALKLCISAFTSLIYKSFTMTIIQTDIRTRLFYGRIDFETDQRLAVFHLCFTLL